MSKITKIFSNLHKAQYVYIALWALFAILLLVVVGLLGGWTPTEANKIVRANALAGVCLFFIIVFFGAICATVYVHGFVLKKAKAKSLAKAGGKK